MDSTNSAAVGRYPKVMSYQTDYEGHIALQGCEVEKVISLSAVFRTFLIFVVTSFPEPTVGYFFQIFEFRISSSVCLHFNIHFKLVAPSVQAVEEAQVQLYSTTSGKALGIWSRDCELDPFTKSSSS